MLDVEIKHGKLVAGFFLLLLASTALLVETAKPETHRQRVFIRSNGNVEPASASILRSGNTYTFTGDVYAELVIQKGGVVIDGAGYALHGPFNGTTEKLWVIGEGPDQVTSGTQIPYSIGVDVGGGATGLTVRNLNIRNFSIGAYIWTTDNLFVGNSVSDCIVGVLLSGERNSITRNYD